jgi:hypothetical protein
VTSLPTHSDHQARGKPLRKPRRLGLYLPWGLALALAVAWSVAWLWLAHEAGRQIDQSAAALRASGWQASWGSRRIGGYPFRLDADFTDLKLADPSGWALAVPQLKGEAYVFEPTHWIFAAPAGLTFTRPTGGAVVVTARLLRASVNGWDKRPPNISVAGDDLTFAPAPGAKPFWLAAAKSLQFDTRAAPDDQGAIWFGIEGGVASSDSWMGDIARGAPVNVTLDGIIFRAGALVGPDWRAAARRWTHSGGGLDVRQFSLTAGATSLDARRGSLAVGDGGALVGELDATLTEPGRLFAGLASENGETETQRLTFHGGSTWVGRARIAPAPRLF